MAGNIFGNLFRITTFGESHGNSLGGIIDGCPAGLKLNFEDIQKELNRRRPGQSSIVTQRNEPDQVNFLSGILDGITTGTPIGFIIYNKDHKSEDYKHIKNLYRPSHSDFTYEKKYGIRDYRGGGRSSARETICRVVAGSIAKQLIKDIHIISYVSSVGNIAINKSYQDLDLSEKNIEKSPIRCPDPYTEKKMLSLIHKIQKIGDTIGGTITCVIKNIPLGIGEPIFDKLHAELAKAMLSINAVKGFEYGSGFFGTQLTGSQHNDLFNVDGTTKTNLSGGIQGGISNGMDIYFKIAFKPVATIMKKQKTIDKYGNFSIIEGEGRHDPCVLPRAIPIVESMTALVIVDYWMFKKLSKYSEFKN
ncbi:chorismate synthase [Blattabacterium sp. (Cryptocercus kyebangensis)]|uniref:chorismate synthase n=1 Tax=Blattabacterium sp. (Cryptocercus kyebangensis) TaxID=298656 RepID=UPI000D7C0FA8|nr:chorismate synthase [Blattabacterium sp. (Cryptocercus kyebangensis)]AWU43630.1 chorismate synthase [Blattabacterium sp. (Cryptocercus kyebangensis)]